MYEVRIRKSAIKDLANLPQDEALRITKQIKDLGEDPRPRGSVKLQGAKNEYRLRVGKYRVLYTVEDKIVTVEIFKVGHRRDIYRK